MYIDNEKSELVDNYIDNVNTESNADNVDIKAGNIIDNESENTNIDSNNAEDKKSSEVYPVEVVELSEKSGIPCERLQSIVTDFGSLNNFRKIYIKFLLTWEPYKQENLFTLNASEVNNVYIHQIFGNVDRFNAFKKHVWYLAKIGKIVTFFDLNEEGFIPAEENLALAYIVGLEEVLGRFFNQRELENRKKSLTQEEKDILNDLIMLNGKRTMAEINKSGQEVCISKERAMKIKDLAITKIMRENALKVWDLGRNNTRRKRFIQKYFEQKDIFITSESFVLDDVLKRDLERILGVDFENLVNSEEIVSEEDVSRVLDSELKELIVTLQTAYDELNVLDNNQENMLEPNRFNIGAEEKPMKADFGGIEF